MKRNNQRYMQNMDKRKITRVVENARLKRLNTV